MSRVDVTRVWVVLLVVVLVGACQPMRRPAVQSARPAPQPVPAPSTRPTVSRPLIDFSRGAAGLPLDSLELPKDAESLRRSLATAYGQRVQTASDRSPVTVVGEYPSLDLVKIDLSDGSIRPTYRPSQYDAVSSLRPAFDVGRLEYVAWPMRYGDASSYLRISASDVKLSLLKTNADKDRRTTLVMTDARAGSLQFHMTQADLRSMLLTAARAHAGKAAYAVSDVKLALNSADSRGLSASMRVDGFWLLFPTSITFSGTMTIDDAFNARFSNFACHGNDVGGAILANFLEPALAKFNGKVSPLAVFPGGRIRVTDVQISTDSDVRLMVHFGSR